MTQTPQTLEFHTSAEYSQKPQPMEFYCAITKNRSFTIWFCITGIEFNLTHTERGGYSYTSKYPLPTHHAIIKHFGIKAAIKKWNESHDQA